jgi:hypothetical protein
MCCAVLYEMSGWELSPSSADSEKAISDVFNGRDGWGWPPGWCVALLQETQTGVYRQTISMDIYP